jgi:hypothetical protein
VNDTRSGAFAGIAFVALAVLWAIVLATADRPSYNSADDAVTEFWTDSGNRRLVLLADLALGLAGVALLWFLGSFRVVLRRAEGEPARLATIAFAGGVVLSALLFVKNAIEGGIALALEFEQGFTLDPDVYRALNAIFLGLLIHEGLAAAVLIGAASLLVLRTRVFTRWLGWTGLAVALVALLSWLVPGLPLVLALVWILVASVLMLRGERTARAIG